MHEILIKSIKYLFYCFFYIQFCLLFAFDKNILDISYDLLQALQRKCQNIVNVMKCVQICNERLQIIKDESLNCLIEEVYSFYAKHHIKIINMNDMYIAYGRPK